MPFENTAGLNVTNQYGPRTSGGTQGVHKTEGFENEYTIDGASQGLPYLFPRGGGVFVYKIDLTYAIGTVSAITVGGLSIMGATEAAPIKIPFNNTGEVVVTGLTGGRVVVYFKKEAGYERDIRPAFPAGANGVTPVTAVAVSPTTLSVPVNGTRQVSPSVTPVGSDQRVTYTSAAPGTATVSASGVVRGVATGSTTITVASVGDPTKTATVAVTVTAS